MRSMRLLAHVRRAACQHRIPIHACIRGWRTCTCTYHLAPSVAESLPGRSASACCCSVLTWRQYRPQPAVCLRHRGQHAALACPLIAAAASVLAECQKRHGMRNPGDLHAPFMQPSF
eukprot:366240-Chlamydomonas_euryale.AAC.3